MSDPAPVPAAEVGAPASVRRERLVVVLVVLAASGLIVLSSGRSWVSGEATGLSGAVPVSVDGRTAAPAAVALGLAGLAAAVVLATAGRLVRALAGVLVLAAGVASAASAVRVPGSARDVLEPAVRTATATTTTGPVSAQASAWPVVVTAAGVLLALAGLVVLVRGRRWPGPSRRYEPPAGPGGEAGAEAARNRARGVAEPDDWEALSRGEDPTLTPGTTPGRDLPD